MTTFKKITNDDIYAEIQAMKQLQMEQHQAVVRRLDFTNGKVKNTRWIATTALTLTLMVVGLLLKGR